MQNFKTNWTTETDVMDERDFARFEFKMSFERMSHIAQLPMYKLFLLGALSR